MKKLRLDVEALRVASFETGREEDARGTVHANAYTNTRPTCVYHCTWMGPSCDYCAAPPRGE